MECLKQFGHADHTLALFFSLRLFLASSHHATRFCISKLQWVWAYECEGQTRSPLVYFRRPFCLEFACDFNSYTKTCTIVFAVDNITIIIINSVLYSSLQLQEDKKNSKTTKKRQRGKSDNSVSRMTRALTLEQLAGSCSRIWGCGWGLTRG